MEKIFDINNLEKQEVLGVLIEVEDLYNRFIKDFKEVLVKHTNAENIVVEDPYISLGNDNFIVVINKEEIKFFESNEDGRINQGFLKGNDLVIEHNQI